ncbi:hypothetical protein Sango_1287400 [Sesamum angolense]|uniref:Reverse transcriptase domain-containing protein n=1 Tax=Sesamum angolense TaxID=2727404 RepID=A0AAE2BUC4_9LAMI|nr:hypothetical protein Sango_1287400 [Sesamum angolense]
MIIACSPSPQGLMALLVYADDTLIAGPSLSEIQAVKRYLHDLFTISKTLEMHNIFLVWKFFQERHRFHQTIYLSLCSIIKSIPHSCEAHWSAAIHVGKYLKGCPSKGIFLPSSNTFELTGYCDGDYAWCTVSRHSLIGFYIFLGSALISWKIKKQTIVSRSKMGLNIAVWLSLSMNNIEFLIF